MSYPSIEIVCGKCGSVINKIISLKSIKDVLRPTNGRCRICGNALNPSEFTIDLERSIRLNLRNTTVGLEENIIKSVNLAKLFVQNIQSKCFDLQ